MSIIIIIEDFAVGLRHAVRGDTEKDARIQLVGKLREIDRQAIHDDDTSIFWKDVSDDELEKMPWAEIEKVIADCSLIVISDNLEVVHLDYGDSY